MIKITPWEHQINAIESCLKMNRKICGMDPGSGKTLVALSITDKLREKSPIMSVVLCPKSALVSWENDINSYTDFTYSVNELSKDRDINIFTFSHIFDLFNATRDLTRDDNAVLHIDEAHMLASEDSNQAEAMRGMEHWDRDGRKKADGIIERFKYVYGYTATMMVNHVENIFYLFNSIIKDRKGNVLFPDFDRFMDRYSIRILRKIRVYNPYKHIQEDKYFKEVTGFQNLEELSEILKPFLFRHSVDYKQKIHTHIFELPEAEMDFYYDVGKGIISKGNKNFVSRLPTLQQAVNGSITVNEKGKPVFRHGIDLSCKERELVNLLNEIATKGEGAIVFTQYKETTFKRFEVLKQYLHFEHYHFLSGDTKDSGRKDIVRDLGANDCLFSTKAGGTSLNFRAVNHAVNYDQPWSCGEFLQNMGRVTRSNSTWDEFNIHLLIAKGTIDEYKYNLLQSNLSVQKELFGGFNFADIFFRDIKRNLVIELRKTLLWGSRKSSKRSKPLPEIKCKNCGRFTNPSVSTWGFVGKEIVASSCNVCWDEKNKVWVEGCNYSLANKFDKEYANRFMGR